MFFLQMSGVPGSGKSTLARAVGQAAGAVVIDHDLVKSALLQSGPADLDAGLAGKMSYEIEWALIDFHLAQGQSVILDSPCLYDVMVERGTALAQKHRATYRYVECVLDDIREVDHRLQTRERMISQNDRVPSEAAFRKAFAGSKKPADVKCLVVDTSQALESYLGEVLRYVAERVEEENGFVLK
ncbi:putative kinase [Tumebacillus sp. BK434]|uniref:AAA family ATPase n=1 Tax=Tumebacillus sp. BK434 TaxID=2512169 RepID=UPI00104EEA45|nr:AAA family ATPase [Tumebacillus sp. BK434]TCP55987.1 putative kinase [Tumebacillus sp. BK434]